MHTYIEQSNGWTSEALADESDLPGSSPTLEKELQGCCFIKEVREEAKNNPYPHYIISEIRYEEQKHNELVIVEAVVFESPKTDEVKDNCYFRRRRFEGGNCKKQAAAYARELKRDIEGKYFS